MALCFYRHSCFPVEGETVGFFRLLTYALRILIPAQHLLALPGRDWRQASGRDVTEPQVCLRSKRLQELGVIDGQCNNAILALQGYCL